MPHGRWPRADIVVWGKALMTEGVLEEHARADAELVSWPNGEVVLTCRLDELAATVAERGMDRHTIVIVGPAMDDGGPGVGPT